MPEWMLYARTVLALVFVAGLIFISAAIAKKCGLDRRLAGAKDSKRRLQVMESLYLDPRHRLVLVRCDGREHLVLLGSSGPLLIETRPAEESHVA